MQEIPWSTLHRGHRGHSSQPHQSRYSRPLPNYPPPKSANCPFKTLYVQYTQAVFLASFLAIASVFLSLPISLFINAISPVLVELASQDLIFRVLRIQNGQGRHRFREDHPRR